MKKQRVVYFAQCKGFTRFNCDFPKVDSAQFSDDIFYIVGIAHRYTTATYHYIYTLARLNEEFTQRSFVVFYNAEINKLYIFIA